MGVACGQGLGRKRKGHGLPLTGKSAVPKLSPLVVPKPERFPLGKQDQGVEVPHGHPQNPLQHPKGPRPVEE